VSSPKCCGWRLPAWALKWVWLWTQPLPARSAAVLAGRRGVLYLNILIAPPPQNRAHWIVPLLAGELKEAVGHSTGQELKMTIRERIVRSRVGLRIVTTIRRVLTPILAPYYRSNVDRCPDLVLTVLGIGHVGNRPSFSTLQRAINAIDQFDGAVIECGVYRGRTLLGMAHLLRRRGIGAKVFGLDSFEGFPEPTAKDAYGDGRFHFMAQEGYFGDVSFAELSRRISRLGFCNQVVLLKGFFEDTLPHLANERFTLVHLDCDLYESYKVCLEFLYNRVLPGGYIVFDEYDDPETEFPGAKRAIDEFFADKPEQIQSFAESEHARVFVRKT